MQTGRNPWIDAARGAALLLMLAFHWQVDRVDFFAQPGDYRQGIWWLTGKASVWLFLLLAGVVAKRGAAGRNLRVAGAALLVSLATYLVMPEAYVRFGILHLLAAAGTCTPWLQSWSPGRLLVLAAALGAGWFLPDTPWTTSWVFGPHAPAATIDHYPAIPWLGVYVAGLALGRAGGRAWLAHRALPVWLAGLAALGRHTLLVYLVHQPVLLGAWQLWRHVCS